MTFEIGPDFKISVKGYNIFQKQAPVRSCYVWLNGETAQIPEGVSTQIAADTARTVKKTEIKKAYKFGGEQVLFTPEEQKAMKNFGDPIIRIIGFKPASSIPLWCSVNKSTFIYPSEEHFVGSTRVFSALTQTLLRGNKVGLAWYIARQNATPVLVAIIPSEEKLDDNGTQILPMGLWLHPLPYADDIRTPPETYVVRAPDDLVDQMRIIVQQLQLPKAQYIPSRYPNPALQWHYRILQAMALDEELPEQAEDKTIPRYRQIDKRAGHYVIKWGQLLDEAYRMHQGARGTKRAAEEKVGPAKKIKAAPAEENHDKLDAKVMKKYADAGTSGKFKVAELKQWLEENGLESGGKKADLVARIEEFFEK